MTADDDADQPDEQLDVDDAAVPHESLPVRIAGAVMAPFVVAGELLGNGVVAFFNATEKLNPVPLVMRVLRPIGDWSMRFMRALRNPLRPLEEALDRVVLWCRRVLAPVSSRVRDLARRVAARLAGVMAVANRLATATQATLRRLFERPRQLWNDVTAPAKRLAAKVRDAARRMLDSS